MPTILLEQIIELLTGWRDSFFTWANGIGDKIASIKTNTDSLPDIKDNTDDIKDNTAAVITPISNINTNVTSISSDTASIRTDTAIVKNNAQAIATSSGQAAAFAQDVANNTLEVKNKITTIASDTTQMRADSGSIRADVSEIKNTLGLYLYNTIVTEDSEGSIANFDTDLQDYLQNAVVTIPADANGISECKIGYVDFNQLNNMNMYNNNPQSGVNFSNNGFYISTSNTSTATVYKQIASITTIPGHKYFLKGCLNTGSNTTFLLTIDGESNSQDYGSGTLYESTKTTSNMFIVIRNNINMNGIVFCPQFIDITQLLGSSIANYLYSLSDRGVSIINSILTHEYYNYSLGGSIVSVQSVNGSYYPNADILFGSSITDGGELDLVTGILTVNTTPPALIQLAPAPIRTLKGLNSIWADIGDIDVTYRETLKHYLEKQEAASRSVNRNANLLRTNIESTEDTEIDSDRRI